MSSSSPLHHDEPPLQEEPLVAKDDSTKRKRRKSRHKTRTHHDELLRQPQHYELDNNNSSRRRLFSGDDDEDINYKLDQHTDRYFDNEQILDDPSRKESSVRRKKKSNRKSSRPTSTPSPRRPEQQSESSSSSRSRRNVRQDEEEQTPKTSSKRRPSESKKKRKKPNRSKQTHGEPTGPEQSDRRDLSSSRSKRKTTTTSHQDDADELLKRKMAEADHILATRLVPSTSVNNNNSRVDKDDLAKKKIAEADYLALARLAPPSSVRSKTEGGSSHHKSDSLYHTLQTIDEENHSGKSATMSPQNFGAPPPTAGTARPLMPLETSMRRTSKIRVTGGDPTTPGAYAIEGFNAASNHDDGLRMPDEELMGGNHVWADEENARRQSNNRELQRELRRSMRLSSSMSIETGSSKDLVSQVSSNKSFPYMDAHVTPIDADYLYGKPDDGLKKEDISLSSSQKARRRRYFRWIAVVFFILPVIVLVALLLVNRSGSDSGDDNSSNMGAEATLSPTASPAPTIPLVPVTVLIWLDDAPKETGWDLLCDEVIIVSRAVGTYNEQPQTVITETLYVSEGSECAFRIFDTAADGLCCLAGKGFYQVYLAEKDDIPNGLVAEGSEFASLAEVFFEATASTS